MSVEIKVPPLGESVSEASVAQWLKKPGEAVEADEPLVELETEKVTLEVNAPAAGVLGEVLAEEGANVSIGAVLGLIDEKAGAAATEKEKPVKKETVEEKQASKKQAAEEKPAAQKEKEKQTSPEKAPAAALGALTLDPTKVARSGAEGGITAQDLSNFLAEASPPSALTLSPAVARLIEEEDLNPTTIRGTGPKGRITKEDVLRVLEKGADVPTPSFTPASAEAKTARPASPPSRGESEERVRMSKLRQTVARRLKEAQNTAAILTTFNEADMSAVQNLRALYKDAFEKKHGIKLGFSSFFVKAVVAALREIPAVNARIEGEEIVYSHAIHIGMAVSTPQGLMVPVVRDCAEKSFAEIEKDVASLAEKGRSGKISMEEMQGGTFTITNGGVFGSLLSTPILNMPQSGILGLHKIMDRPVAVNGKVEIRPMMYLAFSYDHRIIDGREAVTFLVRIKESIENPNRLLFDL